MIELIIGFVLVVLVMWSESADDIEEVNCDEGHNWSNNFLTERLECVRCGMKV